MENDYLEVKELYHYGVKGMRWGVVKPEEEPENEKKVREEYKPHTDSGGAHRVSLEDQLFLETLSTIDGIKYMSLDPESRKLFRSLPSGNKIEGTNAKNRLSQKQKDFIFANKTVLDQVKKEDMELGKQRANAALVLLGSTAIVGAIIAFRMATGL